MTTPPEPALSVVVVTRDKVATVERLIEHLRAQSVRRDLEVVVVGSSVAALDGAGELLEGFSFSQTLVFEGEFTRGRGTELGVRHVRGAIYGRKRSCG